MNIIDYLLSISSKKIKYGLSRTEKLLKACDNPHQKVFSIQIVGTNGKGSVAAMLSSIISSSGYTVGLFSSPHLVKINERIRINNKLIEDKVFQQFITKYKKKIELIEPSFFELLTVIAIWYFHKSKVDYCILETGLGGRYDSVTACDNQGVVFTPISMDHHSLLGNTLSLIATDKSKAINKNTQFVFSSLQGNRVIEIIEKQANKYDLQLMLSKKMKNNILLKNLYGLHQLENAELSKRVISYLNDKKIINVSKKQILSGIRNTVWFGRFQIIKKKPTVIFDVAHNKSSIESFMNSFKYFRKKNNFKKTYLLCAFERNKKIKSKLKYYENLFDYIICSETSIRDSMPVNDIALIFRNKKKIVIKPNLFNAIEYSMSKINEKDVLLIMGSHFMGPAINRFFKNCFALDHKRLLT